MIEYLLGFEADVPRNKIAWHITRTEEHGLKNLKLGANTITMLCERRSKHTDACRLSVSTTGTFTLTVITGPGKRGKMPQQRTV